MKPKPAEERYRMRPLTDAELEAVCATARSRAKGKGPVPAMRQLWDLILRESAGVGLEEATERGLRFHVADFQIAASQARVIQSAMCKPYGAKRVAFLWLSDSPGEYEDEPGPEVGP